MKESQNGTGILQLRCTKTKPESDSAIRRVKIQLAVINGTHGNLAQVTIFYTLVSVLVLTVVNAVLA
jgi:hypothetical protein